MLWIGLGMIGLLALPAGILLGALLLLWTGVDTLVQWLENQEKK